MTIPSTPRKAGPLLGTGAQTSWPFTFKVFAESDIGVTIANSTGVETALTLDTDYSVTLNPNQDTSPGGTVTYPISGAALPVGSVLSIVGDLEYDQPLDLPSGGNFSPVALENELDRLTMQIQQIKETLGRSLLVPVTSDAAPSLPIPEANQLIGWDASGQNLQNVDIADLATAVTYGTFRYDTFVGDGVTTQFTPSANPATIANLDVAVDGLTWVPGTDYSLVSGVVVFATAPVDGAEILVRYGEAMTSAPGDAADISYHPAGTGAVVTTVQSKLHRFERSVLDYGIVADGATDQTAALVAYMATLSGESFRGWISIPYGTKFNVSTVYAAVPVGVILDDESCINWGQPPGYKNKFRIMYSGDSVADDTIEITASGHHPTIALLNTGTTGTASATNRYASILHGVGKDYKGDILTGWFMQFGKTPSSTGWNCGWRMLTPYAIAIKNPQRWVTATVYAAGAYCVSDSGKIYTTTAGGTSGVTAPTGTGTAINDGGVLWDYAQAGLTLDTTVFNFDEGGNMRIAALSGTPTFTQVSGEKSHYFSVNSTSGNIIWRDVGRSTNIATITDASGFQFGMAQSFDRTAMTGTGPDAPTTGAGKIANGGATNMSTMIPPAGRTRMLVNLRFDNSNTTVVHGTGANGLTLKGAVNATPAVGQFMVFEYDSTLSGRWFEVSRSF